MSNFARLQQDFQNYLHSGLTDIEPAIIDAAPISTPERMQIYRIAYQYRLLEALGANFSCVKAYLGADEFKRLVFSYIKDRPSTYRSVRWYGDELATYIKHEYVFADTATNSVKDFLAELAQFEWLLMLAFDAADATVCDLTAMAAIPPDAWETMILKFHPSLRRADFMWNVVDIWDDLSNERAPKELVQLQTAQPWVLWRRDYLSRFYSLTTDEAWALDAMFRGQTFSFMCEGLCQWHDEDSVGMRAASLLKGWIQFGLISEIIYEK